MPNTSWQSSRLAPLYEELINKYGSPVGSIAPDDDADDIPEAMEFLLQRLSQEEQNILVQHFVEGKPYVDIAQELGMPRNSVHSVATLAMIDMARYDGDLFLRYGYRRGMERYGKRTEQYREKVETYIATSINLIPFKGISPSFYLNQVGINTLDELDAWLQDPDSVKVRSIGYAKKAMIKDAYLQYIADGAWKDPLNAKLSELTGIFINGYGTTAVKRLADMGIITIGDLKDAKQEGRLVPTGKLRVPHIRAIEYYARPWLAEAQ